MEDFRRFRTDELDSGYAILMDAFKRLRSKGIEQWPQPFPLNLHQTWHRTESNYGLFQNGELAVVITFRRRRLSHWEHVVGHQEHLWILALATATCFKGKGLGKEAMHHAIQWIMQEKPQDICLDCEKGDGFLQQYYSNIDDSAKSPKFALGCYSHKTHLVYYKYLTCLNLTGYGSEIDFLPYHQYWL